MPGRSANSSSYRYGFNGQEKEPETADGIYSAEFWQYDSRLGRRWNIDPVVKPWRSPYDGFDNNPTNKVDPKGNDDYFDLYGNFLGTDGSKTNNVHIVNHSDPRSIPMLFISGSPGAGMINSTVAKPYVVAPSSLNYSGYVGAGNVRILGGIATHYGRMMGIDEVGVGDRSEKGPIDGYSGIGAYYNVGSDRIFAATSFGRINSLWNNKYDILSILEHEQEHKRRREDSGGLPIAYMDHADVYLFQITSPTFKKTTATFQQSIVGGLMREIQDGLNSGQATMADAQARVNRYNALNLKTEMYIEQTGTDDNGSAVYNVGHRERKSK